MHCVYSLSCRAPWRSDVDGLSMWLKPALSWRVWLGVILLWTIRALSIAFTRYLAGLRGGSVVESLCLAELRGKCRALIVS